MIRPMVRILLFTSRKTRTMSARRRLRRKRSPIRWDRLAVEVLAPGRSPRSVPWLLAVSLSQPLAVGDDDDGPTSPPEDTTPPAKPMITGISDNVDPVRVDSLLRARRPMTIRQLFRARRNPTQRSPFSTVPPSSVRRRPIPMVTGLSRPPRRLTTVLTTLPLLRQTLLAIRVRLQMGRA